MNYPNQDESIDSRMSHEEIDSLLASELEKVGISSPCTPDLFYAMMNGQNVEDSTSGPEVQGSKQNTPRRDSITESTCSNSSNVSDLTDEDSRARRKAAKRAVAQRRHRIRKKKQSIDVDFDPESCLALSSDARKPSSSSKISSSARDADEKDGSTKEGKVSFGTIGVRHYERIIELNPAVSSGVPVGIGWRYRRGGEISVDEFELHRGGARYKPEELVIPRAIRESMVKEFGYSQKDIADATRICLRLKNQRKQTIDNLQFQGVEEKFESASRRMIKAITFGGNATKRG